MNEKINFKKLPLCLTLIFAAISQAAAHEKWFHETENYSLRWDLFFRPLPLIFVGAILLITLAAGFWWRKRGKGFVPGPENFGTTDERRSALYGLIPLILGIHVAVPLSVSGVSGELFIPNNYKVYQSADATRLHFIQAAKSLGFSLTEIREILSEAKHGNSPCPMVREIIERHIEENRRKIKEMQKLQKKMETALNDWKQMTNSMPNGDSVCHLIESVAEVKKPA